MALARYDNNEFDEALGDFDSIGDTSKILFNMGVIHATLGEHEKAVRVTKTNPGNTFADLTPAGGMLPTSHPVRPVPRRRVLPARRFQLPVG